MKKIARNMQNDFMQIFKAQKTVVYIIGASS